MDILDQAPRWLLRPVGAFVELDDDAIQLIERAAQQLPHSIGELNSILKPFQSQPAYDAPANLANAYVWKNLDSFMVDAALVRKLCNYSLIHLPHPAVARLIRRLIVDPRFQRYGKRLLADSELQEVTIRATLWNPANTASWSRSRAGKRFRGSSERRTEQGVPEIATVGALRELLKIRSTAQLGFLLSAATEPNGPYTSFEIPKRRGEPRVITAPCGTLRWVQRRILRDILSHVPPDDAAHGFVQTRSTATNAAPHVKAKIVLKFDLRDFFPTIHEYRVMGLFASMGYHVGTARYSTDDRSHDVAPVLARLCCVALPSNHADSKKRTRRTGPAVLPQGGPTSPAISNLVCRRLDQRLTGLAQKFAGEYTRYADDLTFSFRDEIDIGRFRWWVDQICFLEGFTIRQDKFRAIRSSQQQHVTGIVVNERMNLPREVRRRFRALLHQCRRDGVAAVAQRQPGIEGYMRGFAAYVHMVDPSDQGKLMHEVDAILSGRAT